MAAKPQKQKRQRRSPHEIAVESIVKMSIGELIKTANVLASREPDTAQFFIDQMKNGLTQNELSESEG